MSKGKHRRRHLRRAFITTGLAALAVMGTGFGIAQAVSSPQQIVRIAGDPVLPAEPIMAPAPSQSSAAPSRTYIVREGDSLFSVATSQCHSGNDWHSLATANHISYPYPVIPGQHLTVTC